MMPRTAVHLKRVCTGLDLAGYESTCNVCQRQMPLAFSELALTFASCFSPTHLMQGVSFPGAPTATLSTPPTTTPGGSPTRGCSVSTAEVTQQADGRMRTQAQSP